MVEPERLTQDSPEWIIRGAKVAPLRDVRETEFSRSVFILLQPQIQQDEF